MTDEDEFEVMIKSKCILEEIEKLKDKIRFGEH